MSAYLDHAASSPLRPEALEAMLPWLDHRDGHVPTHANPTAAHRRGRRARQALDEARETIASATGFARGDVVFTGGGTEADNQAILGRPGLALVGSTEHPAVLEAAHRGDCMEIPVDRDGLISSEAIISHFESEVEGADHLRAPTQTSVASFMTVNNETGVIQDVAVLFDLVARLSPATLRHTDAVQALPWLDLSTLGPACDMMSVTGHKLGGPQGVGALLVRDGLSLDPLLIGGGQERDRRAGTQNVAGIVGFATAVAAAQADREVRLARMQRLAEHLLGAVNEELDEITLTVPETSRVPGIVHLLIADVQSEPLLFLLDEADVACSAASSCASGAQGASHVLSAMGIDTTNCAPLRLSLGWSTTETEIDYAIDAITTAVRKLRDGKDG